MFEICFILYKSTFFKKEEKGKKELSGAHKYIKVVQTVPFIDIFKT